jgi:small subunit ribosomal protein S13
LRIAGVQIPDAKRIEVALTYVYGIGPSNVRSLLQTAKIDPDKRAKDLGVDEVTRLQKVVAQMPIEGKLRQQVRDDVQRLRSIGSYRGKRHVLNLPVRGQRTRTNARIKRGKRQTIGAMRKRDRAKLAGG